MFGILARHRISVDLITTSRGERLPTLDHTGSQSNGEPILNDKVLAELGQLYKVEVETGFALVALIGNRMSEAAGVGSQVFDAIREHNIRMICYGASAHNLCFLVKEDEAGHIVNCLHWNCSTESPRRWHTSEASSAPSHPGRPSHSAKGRRGAPLVTLLPPSAGDQGSPGGQQIGPDLLAQPSQPLQQPG